VENSREKLKGNSGGKKKKRKKKASVMNRQKLGSYFF
jgi:hypothetical protein